MLKCAVCFQVPQRKDRRYDEKGGMTDRCSEENPGKMHREHFVQFLFPLNTELKISKRGSKNK